jgi:hypothetical protein
MENIKDISFDANGNPTITLNDDTVTNYVVAPAAGTPQAVTLTSGQTLTVTAA